MKIMEILVRDAVILNLGVRTKNEVLGEMAAALDHMEVAGTVTNVRFLRRLVDHPGFVEGDLDTGIIDRDLTGLTRHEDPTDEVLALAAVTALDLDRSVLAGFTLWSPFRPAWPFMPPFF